MTDSATTAQASTSPKCPPQKMAERGICGDTAACVAGAGVGALASALVAWLHGSKTSPGLGAHVGFAGGGLVHGSTVTGTTCGGHFLGAQSFASRAASPTQVAVSIACGAGLGLQGVDTSTRFKTVDAGEAVGAVAIVRAREASAPPHGNTCCCATDTDPRSSTPTTPMMIEDRRKELSA